jgi:hypothetical protein
VEKFKSNQNLVHEEIKSILNVENACYHSLQNIFFLPVMCKHKDKNVQNCKCALVLYDYETWAVTLRDEHRLWVFEYRVLRRMFELKRNEIIGGWSKLRIEELLNCTSCQILE